MPVAELRDAIPPGASGPATDTDGPAVDTADGAMDGPKALADPDGAG